MKNILILFFVIFIFINVNAQTPVKDQPGQPYFDLLDKTIVEKTLPEKDLLAAKPADLPQNFLDTLKKYDWLYVGGYSYSEKKYTGYKNFYKEYKIIRFDENGGKQDFSINGYNNNLLVSLNFQNPPRQHWKILKINNVWQCEQQVPDGKEYHKIVSYQNGVFIYLVNKSGRANDNVPYFRECYAAVPKMFQWTYGE